MSELGKIAIVILILQLASATQVGPYQQRTATPQRPENLHAADAVSYGPGLLSYGFAVRALQLPKPWSSWGSWVLRWALHAVQQPQAPAEPPSSSSSSSSAAAGGSPSRTASWPHDATGSAGQQQQQQQGRAAHSHIAAGSSPHSSCSGIASGGGGGGPFQELYGSGDAQGSGPGGACYDAAADNPTGGSGPSARDAAAGGGRGASPRSSGGDSEPAFGAGAAAAAAAAAAAVARVAPGRQNPPRPPVIYIPPLTGTELQAKLNNKPSAPRWWCPRRTPRWFRLWVTLQALLPWEFPCYADNLRLIPGGPGGGGARPPPGVETRVGSTLEPAAAGGGDPRVGGDGAGPQGPWAAIARELRQRGWTDELLGSHPYDWRLSPVEWSRPGGSFSQLRSSVEDAVASSGRRVVLLGLSMGGTYAVAFLNSLTALGAEEAEWKEAHIERLVTMSGVWTGTPRSPWDVISGRLEGLEAVLDRAAIRQLLRGIPALAWTFPAPSPGAAPGDPGGPPVLTNLARGRDYGPAQLGQALRDAGATEAAEFWEASLPTTSLASSPPNVSTHCFYSYGLSCAVHVTYAAADFSDARPAAVSYDDGDVTVPHASLAACRGWAARQAAPVRSYSYFGVVHGMLTTVPEALNDIVDAVAGEEAG